MNGHDGQDGDDRRGQDLPGHGDAGLSPETEQILRHARHAERMPTTHKRRLKGAVLARIAFASTATLAAGQATALGLVTKAAVGIALVGSLGAGSYLALRPARPHAKPATHVALAPRVEPAPVVLLEPAPAPVEAPPPVVHRRPPERHAAAPASDLAEETVLLRDADGALRAGDPGRALALLDQHAARFPKGALAPERAAEWLIVTCQLGVADPRRVDQFLASRAASPLAARVRKACAPK